MWQQQQQQQQHFFCHSPAASPGPTVSGKVMYAAVPKMSGGEREWDSTRTRVPRLLVGVKQKHSSNFSLIYLLLPAAHKIIPGTTRRTLGPQCAGEKCDWNKIASVKTRVKQLSFFAAELRWAMRDMIWHDMTRHDRTWRDKTWQDMTRRWRKVWDQQRRRIDKRARSLYPKTVLLPIFTWKDFTCNE